MVHRDKVWIFFKFLNQFEPTTIYLVLFVSVFSFQTGSDRDYSNFWLFNASQSQAVGSATGYTPAISQSPSPTTGLWRVLPNLFRTSGSSLAVLKSLAEKACAQRIRWVLRSTASFLLFCFLAWIFPPLDPFDCSSGCKFLLATSSTASSPHYCPPAESKSKKYERQISSPSVSLPTTKYVSLR